MNTFFALLIGAGFMVVLAMMVARAFFSDAIFRPAIRKWALREKIDYAIDDVDWLEEWPFFDRGPFLFRMVNTQKVYRLLVTKEGQERIAYVRVGHWLFGLLNPVVAMR